MRAKNLFIIFLIMIIMPGPNISAANNNNTEIRIHIDYINETIRLSGISGTAAVKYMYSPNVSAGAEAVPKRQASEKWYPIYGDEIDISKYIPDNDKNGGFIFAFRDADETAGSDGTYKSRKTTEIIRGRPNISAAEFKSNIGYSPRTERIEIKSLGAYDYQAGISLWLLDNTAQFIDASSKYNPLGGTFTFRTSAVQGKSFASNEYKLKIPKAPSVPNVKTNAGAKKLTGVQTSFEWSASENGAFTNFRDRSGNVNIFKENINSFTVEKDASGSDCIAVYIRVASTDKAPTSLLQKLLINKSWIE